MKLEDKIEQCLVLQNELNNRIDPEWKYKGREWYRAAYMEAKEILDHIGWKWWKKQEPNHRQAFIELVDIFHFFLCENIETGNKTLFLVESFDKKIVNDLANTIERFVNTCITEKYISGYFFVQLICAMGYRIDDLVDYYIKKNTLNLFRQDNGYKDGTYIKIWNGREDNEVLEDCDSFDPVEIRKYLESEYAKSI